MKKQKYSKGKQKQLALEHIKNLFTEAEEVFSANKENKAFANRYVKLARQIAMKMRMRLPVEYKRRFCKYCWVYLRPGVNARVRTRKGKVVIYCLECKKVRRVGIR